MVAIGKRVARPCQFIGIAAAVAAYKEVMDESPAVPAEVSAARFEQVGQGKLAAMKVPGEGVRLEAPAGTVKQDDVVLFDQNLARGGRQKPGEKTFAIIRAARIAEPDLGKDVLRFDGVRIAAKEAGRARVQAEVSRP